LHFFIRRKLSVDVDRESVAILRGGNGEVIEPILEVKANPIVVGLRDEA
jgi:hypothetical protein